MGNKLSTLKRYSRKDLDFFEHIILDKLTQEKSELEETVVQLKSFNYNGTDDTATSYKTLDDSCENYLREELNRTAQRQRKFVERLEEALLRIRNGTYGICRATGNLIPRERLKAVPHATLCIEAKQGWPGGKF